MKTFDTCNEKKYIIKAPRDGVTARQKLVVKEHIASSLYYLFGVLTPKLFITSDDEGKPLLASEVLTSYQDLSDFMGGDDFLRKLDGIDEKLSSETIRHRVSFFSERLGKMNVKLRGREALLLASIILQDLDVLGRCLDNVGVIPSLIEPLEFQVVKIDPGSASLDTDFTYFKEDISTGEPLLSAMYASDLANLGKTALGPMHYKEFFNKLNQTNLRLAVDTIRAISESEIKKHIIRDGYLNYVQREYLERVAQTVIERRDYIVSLFDAKYHIEGREVVAPSLFRPASDFYKTGVQIPKGVSRPTVAIEMEESSSHQRIISTSV